MPASDGVPSFERRDANFGALQEEMYCARRLSAMIYDQFPIELIEPLQLFLDYNLFNNTANHLGFVIVGLSFVTKYLFFLTKSVINLCNDQRVDNKQWLEKQVSCRVAKKSSIFILLWTEKEKYRDKSSITK